MPQPFADFQQEYRIPAWPFDTGAGASKQTPAGYEADEHRGLPARSDRVLHREWGVGRVLRVHADDMVTVRWSDNVRTVPVNSLRRVLPRTLLARQIESAAPEITAWMIRRADEQGRIRPDATGQFAGHKVHYYDAARVPALIEELSKQDAWPAGTFVIHSQFGTGRITGNAAGRSGLPGARSQNRTVQFFVSDSVASVPVAELRRLISGHAMARLIGVERKTFARQAGRHGLQPDLCEGLRTWYDEGRTEEIRRRWHSPAESLTIEPGSLVIDPAGDIAILEYVDDNGQAHLRCVQDSTSTKACITQIRELVSIRELSRRHRMSRYKLQRLLSAADTEPVYRRGKTIYFDGTAAAAALRTQLRCEDCAVTLRVVAQRTGLSAEVLAKKVRLGCIRTIRRDGIYLVGEEEAKRIQDVVAALNDESESLAALGICRFQQRGRHGLELVEWDIARLINTVYSLTGDQRCMLLQQTAWVCEGAGMKRFQQAVHAYIGSARCAEEGEQQMAVQSLLMVLDSLPASSATRAVRLLVTAYGCAALQRCRQAWKDIESSLGAVLAQCTDVFCASDGFCPETTECVYPEDEFVPGAIIISVRDGRPHPGVIVRVEQQSWNTLARRWDKTIFVRFAEGERYVNPRTPCPGSAEAESLGAMLLLDTDQARACFAAVTG